MVHIIGPGLGSHVSSFNHELPPGAGAAQFVIVGPLSVLDQRGTDGEHNNQTRVHNVQRGRGGYDIAMGFTVSTELSYG